MADASNFRYPRLLEEWAYDLNIDVSPEELTLGSTRRVWWRCSRGHEWQATLNDRNRLKGGRGCPFCTGRRVLAGFNDLATTHPDLTKDWDFARNGALTPTTVNAGSTRRTHWVCHKCGHAWSAKVCARSLAGSRCPACAGVTPVPGKNTLDLYPEVAALWHPQRNGTLQPAQIHAGSQRRYWWLCTEGHEWEAPVQRVVASYKAVKRQKVTRPFGCSACVQSSRTPRQPLGQVMPELLEEVDTNRHPNLDAIATLTTGSERKVWWVCARHQHCWQATVKSRVAGSGCPYCSNRRVLKGFNDLATTNPLLAQCWHPTLNGSLTPDSITAKSRHKVHWICPNGHYSVGSPMAKTTAPGIVFSCRECLRERHRHR